MFIVSILDSLWFKASLRIVELGDYVIDLAFEEN